MSSYTRREFAKLALTALPAAGLLSSVTSLRAAETPATAGGKPNSKVAGVQIGLNVPYSFSNPTMSGDDIIKNCVALGVSGVELRTQPVEAFLGSPVPASVAAKGAAADPATVKATAATLEKWRLAVPMDQVKAFRKKFDDAGVKIEIVKVDGIFKMSDAVLDYVFTMAKTLGARALSTEISKDEADHERVGKFADKHQFWIGYHGHATTNEEHFLKAVSTAKYNGINLDIGHYVAGGNGSPVEFLKKHHAKVTHVHIKDRKWVEATKNGPNTPFGEGDTPIKDVLRLIRDNKWPIQATIEFEYKVPEGSTRMAEIAKAVQYCRDALA
ncbi:MAG: sugar phosphate isomerase/epimerase [Verrucomicrobia bacterium]|nr:sugar phosphate isomerase/epimerase [Verrucomicrobiota bacterium]